MVKGILSDNDVRGPFDALIRVCTSPSWREVWTSLGLRTYTLEALGLPADAVDAEIWRICQQEGLVLVTGNRNAKGEDSLENTIRVANEPTSLPVLTLADPAAVERDRDYAEQVAVRLMEVLSDINNYYGCGRLFLP